MTVDAVRERLGVDMQWSDPFCAHHQGNNLSWAARALSTPGENDMDQDFKEFVDRCFEVSARKEDISRDDIIRMLGVSPDSEECEYLGSRARELAAIKSKDKATLGTPFGVDYVPCDASCRFCSFGTRWGLMEGQSYHIPVEDIISMMKERIAAGYTGFTIRTTEFYPVDKLCEMARRIREEVPGDYRLGVNTGELTLEGCIRLKEAGYNSAYHTLHLREGIALRSLPRGVCRPCVRYRNHL